MTTMNISDISHKRKVSTHYQPNSYRIFCEDIPNDSVPVANMYSDQAPSIYSHPLIVPAQAAEDRNRPHGGRAAAFLRENARTLNEPVAAIHTPVEDKDQNKWWVWNNHQAQDADPNWKHKKRSQSITNLSNPDEKGHGSGFQTTYQKEHGYLTHDFYRNKGALKSVNGAVNRHSNNPNTQQAAGIVPITDYKNYAPDNQERLLVDRVSFENQYDSRDPNNYPLKGKRHGAFVIEQVEPKPVLGTKIYQDMNKGTSVWDCMHPVEEPRGNSPLKAQVYQKPPSGKLSESRNQRRDPIGYFEDTKYNTYQQPIINDQVRPDSKYKPSWNPEPVIANGAFNGYPTNGYSANDYADPIAPNGELNGYNDLLANQQIMANI